MPPPPEGYHYVQIDKQIPDPLFLCLALIFSIVFFPFGLLLCFCIPSRTETAMVLQPIRATPPVYY
jgi:hypothetical protein